MIAFNPSLHNDELSRLHEEFIAFAYNNFEDELHDIVDHFINESINVDDEKELAIYTNLLFAWAFFLLFL